MDITLTFDNLLAKQGAQHLPVQPFQVSKLNGFMRDAYRINSLINELVINIRKIRAPYLALPQHHARRRGANGSASSDHVQPFTDRQREEVDEQMKFQLKRIDESLKQLSEAVDIKFLQRQREQTQRRKKGRLGGMMQWAAGGAPQEKTPEEIEEDFQMQAEKDHEMAAITSLRMRLQQAGKVQENIVKTRMNREIERSQNILSKSRGDRFKGEFSTDPSRSTLTAMDIDMEADQAAKQERERIRKDIESRMSPAQLQQLQLEENVMMKHYNAELEKIQKAQSSILEISDLQTELTMHLERQSEVVSDIKDNFADALSNVKEANKQLEKATQRFRPAMWVWYGSLATAGWWLLWDAIF